MSAQINDVRGAADLAMAFDTSTEDGSRHEGRTLAARAMDAAPTSSVPLVWYLRLSYRVIAPNEGSALEHTKGPASSEVDGGFAPLGSHEGSARPPSCIPVTKLILWYPHTRFALWLT